MRRGLGRGPGRALRDGVGRGGVVVWCRWLWALVSRWRSPGFRRSNLMVSRWFL